MSGFVKETKASNGDAKEDPFASEDAKTRELEDVHFDKFLELDIENDTEDDEMVGASSKNCLSPFLTSETAVMDEAFKMLKLSSEDFILDLGCGDGRVLLHAAQTVGAKGMGLDIEDACIVRAKAMCEERRLTHLCHFSTTDFVANAPKNDGGFVTVIFLYLVEEALNAIRESVEAFVVGGNVRVITNTYHFSDWNISNTHVSTNGTLTLYDAIAKPKVQSKEVLQMEKEEEDNFDTFFLDDDLDVDPFQKAKWHCPFLPSPTSRVDFLLDFLNIGPESKLLDIGCGDGRVLIRAAQERGCKCYGVDINEKLISVANETSLKAGVESLCTFVQGDALGQDEKKVDILGLSKEEPFSCCVLYVVPDFLKVLKPLLLKLNKRDKVKIVTLVYHYKDWAPSKADFVYDVRVIE